MLVAAQPPLADVGHRAQDRQPQLLGHLVDITQPRIDAIEEEGDGDSQAETPHHGHQDQPLDKPAVDGLPGCVGRGSIINSPFRNETAWGRSVTGHTFSPSTTAASAALSRGSRRPVRPLALAVTAMESAPLIGFTRPSTQNDAQSFRWFREAALAGDPAAQHYLGLFYLGGVGTEIDLEGATLWLRRCAELNQPERLLSLAWFTLNENGLPHGAVHTAALLRNLAELGYRVAQYSLGIFRRDRAGETAEEDGETWLRQSAERGYAEAQFQLGLALLGGSELSADPEEAVAWFRRAAKQEDARAMRNLGVAHFTGRGVARDVATAYRWFWLAARHGSAAAGQDVRYLEALLGVGLVQEARDAGLAWERAQGLPDPMGTSPPAP